MATITKFVDKKVPANTLPGKVIAANTIIDFAEGNAAAGDVIQSIPIKKGSYVLSVGLRVITQEGSTATVKLGDGSDDDRYGAAINVNASTEASSSQTHYYDVDDTIDLVANHTIGTAKVDVFVTFFESSTGS